MEITHRTSPEGGFYLAEEDGQRMGYLSYEWADDTVFAIMHTVVDKAFQGRGIAKALLDAAVAFARENGYKVRPVCPYAEKVFNRDPSYAKDVLYVG